MPWVDFETMGPCVAPGKNRVTFGGFLFDRDWGWHSDPPTESNGLQVPFAPLLEVGEGACGPWATPTFPHAAAMPRSEWAGIIERSAWKGYIPGRPPVTSS